MDVLRLFELPLIACVFNTGSAEFNTLKLEPPPNVSRPVADDPNVKIPITLPFLFNIGLPEFPPMPGASIYKDSGTW